jgi:metal-responsive CopG/Arc/MetJ family transcriptional regulator
MGVVISVSIPEEIFDLIRATEDLNPRMKRSAVVALLIRNGYARLKELEEQAKNDEGGK